MCQLENGEMNHQPWCKRWSKFVAAGAGLLPGKIGSIRDLRNYLLRTATALGHRQVLALHDPWTADCLLDSLLQHVCMCASHYFLLLKPVAFTSHRTQEDIDGCSYQGWQVDNQQYSYKLVANLKRRWLQEGQVWVESIKLVRFVPLVLSARSVR